MALEEDRRLFTLLTHRCKPSISASWTKSPSLSSALFISYSIAVVSIYLALELRLIEVIPFSRQMDPTRNSVVLPTMMVGGMAMGVAVGLQYLIFQFPTLVVVA